MIRTRTSSLLAVACLAGASATALGQSASVTLVPSSSTAAPGDSIQIDIVVDFMITGGPGVFGDAGLYGFGGDVQTSADPADASLSGPTVDGALLFGQTASIGSGGSSIRAAGGRGLSNALLSSPQTVGSFMLDINPNAADGSFSLGYSGAVVLSDGNGLRTFSTSPGVNQSLLTVADIGITIMGGSDCVADVTTTGATLMGQPGFGEPDGVADLDDLGYFLNFWAASNLTSDFTTTGATLMGQPGFGVPDGVVDLDDLGYFLNFWQQGCP